MVLGFEVNHLPYSLPAFHCYTFALGDQLPISHSRACAESDDACLSVFRVFDAPIAVSRLGSCDFDI